MTLSVISRIYRVSKKNGAVHLLYGLIRMVLLDGTVPSTNSLLDGTVPSTNPLLDGTLKKLKFQKVSPTPQSPP